MRSFEILEVTWADAHAVNEDREYATLDIIPDFIEVKSVGYKIRETEVAIMLGQSYAEEYTSDLLIIPKTYISNIRKI